MFKDLFSICTVYLAHKIHRRDLALVIDLVNDRLSREYPTDLPDIAVHVGSFGGLRLQFNLILATCSRVKTCHH
jgi:hypothetical protein